jgi:FkbM family methyltransferase
MPILKYRSSTLTGFRALVPEIVYVMCGARGEEGNRLMRALPQLKFVGFEPDAEEYARLTARPSPRFTFFGAAVGAENQQRTLYITRNPGCSSLLRPNHAFYRRFKDCGPDLEIVRELPVEAVSLDSFLPSSGIQRVDFLDLDTQGSELEILRGAQAFLSTSVVGVRCEVEFSPLYQEQALFGDIDAYLRGFGFQLFDLGRSRYRRAGFMPHALTRGQLLWGDALYLRSHEWFLSRSNKQGLFTLCLMAAHLQFHDYALEVMNILVDANAATLSERERASLTAGRDQYVKDLTSASRWADFLYALEGLGLKRAIRLIGRLSTQLGDRLRKDRSMTEYNWTD